MRYAIVRGFRITEDKIAAYLPSNYEVVCGRLDDDGQDAILIEGEDYCGWTMEDYILPRLASGLWFGREVEELEAEAFKLSIDLREVGAGR